MALRQRDLFFLSDEGPMLKTLDYTIRIGSTPTILYFDFYLYSAYAGHYVYYIYSIYIYIYRCFKNNKVNLSVREIYILRLNRDQLRKMQLQGLRLGLEPEFIYL